MNLSYHFLLSRLLPPPYIANIALDGNKDFNQDKQPCHYTQPQSLAKAEYRWQSGAGQYTQKSSHIPTDNDTPFSQTVPKRTVPTGTVYL